jgi:hypothetical protein
MRTPTCECGNPKAKGAEACTRCAEIDARLNRHRTSSRSGIRERKETFPDLRRAFNHFLTSRGL